MGGWSMTCSLLAYNKPKTSFELALIYKAELTVYSSYSSLKDLNTSPL